MSCSSFLQPVIVTGICVEIAAMYPVTILNSHFSDFLFETFYLRQHCIGTHNLSMFVYASAENF